MNLFERFSIGTRSVNNYDTGSKSNESDLATIIDEGQLRAVKLVQDLRKLSYERQEQYHDYQEMAEDTLVSAAIELYADDSTQQDKTGKICWVVSDDKDLQDLCNSILTSLDVDSRLWDWAYQICNYGDFYLKTFRDTDGHLEEYVEECDDPSIIFDLTEKGKTVHFAELKSSGKRGQDRKEILLHDSNEFVHFYVKQTMKSETLTLEIDGEEDPITYKVMRGSSIIENVRSVYKVLKLLEDTLIASRLSKSTLLRLFMVEVGNLPNKKAKSLIHKFKTLITTKQSLDTIKGSMSSSRQGVGISDPLVIPVKNGKGSVTHEEVGGDIDVHSIVDIDYFRNKFFAGIKIPKAFLGFEDSIPGGQGNTTLTKQDIRYARAVKRVQKAIKAGIKTLLNLYLIDRGLEGRINDFTVNLVEPSSAEESDRITDLKDRIDAVRSLIELVGQSDSLDPEEVLKIMFRDLIGIPELYDLFEQAEKEAEESDSSQQNDGDSSSDDEGNGGGPSEISSKDYEIPKDTVSEPPADDKDRKEENTEKSREIDITNKITNQKIIDATKINERDSDEEYKKDLEGDEIL